MRTRMNLVRSLCCLLVIAIVEVTIARAELESTVGLTGSEEDRSDIQLKRYADFIKNYYYMFGKAR